MRHGASSVAEENALSHATESCEQEGCSPSPALMEIGYEGLPPETRRLCDEHLQRVADHLERLCSGIPFYADRARRWPNYWLTLAKGSPNLLPGWPLRF